MFRLVAIAALLVAGCGTDDERRVRLVRVAPAADPACGAAADGRAMLVRALGDFAPTEASAQQVELSGGDFRIDRFPAATRALEIEIRGFGDALRGVGRTGEIDLDELDDGAAIAIFVAPPLGSCPTGPPLVARDRPLIAPIAGGALIAGGVDDAGQPVDGAERYHRATGEFRRVEGALYGDAGATGLDGATLTALADGRVVIAGGGLTAYQIFDPTAGALGQAVFLPEARARHAAVALSGAEVLLAGGCAQVEGAGCPPGAALSTTSILDADRGTLRAGPRLRAVRIGGLALREGRDRVVLVGGVDEDGEPLASVERIDLGAGTTELLDAAPGAAAVELASGSVLSGFAPPGAAATGDLGVVPVGGVPVALPGQSARSGAGLIALESGRVLALGGDDDGTAELLSVLGDSQVAAAVDGDRRGFGAVRLDDASVLITGGRRADGSLRDDAVVFRPSLHGALSPSLSIVPALAGALDGVVPRDPSRVEMVDDGGDAGGDAAPHLVASNDDVDQWLVFAGPVFRDLAVDLDAEVTGGGLGVLLGWRGADDHSVVELRPGEVARVVTVRGGERQVEAGCSGEPLELEGVVGGELHLELRGTELDVTLGGAAILRCDLAAPPAEGSLGVVALGPGAALRLSLVTATR